MAQLPPQLEVLEAHPRMWAPPAHTAPLRSNAHEIRTALES